MWAHALPPGRRLEVRNLAEFQARFGEALEKNRPADAGAAVAAALEAGLGARALLERVGLAAAEAFRGSADVDQPAAEHFRNARVVESALEKLEPLIEAEAGADGRPPVVIGNAYQDYHDLGRRIVACCLRGAGYRVIDLGLSVENERFVEAARESGTRVVGVSSLLLHTAKHIPALKQRLAEAGLGRVKVIVGGAPFTVDPRLRDKYGADGVARDPASAIRLVHAIYAEVWRNAL